MQTKVRGICAYKNCGLPHEARGWCVKHYTRVRSHGSPDVLKRFSSDYPLEVRVWARIDRSGGPDACWPWTGARNRKGYGLMRENGKTCLATHLVYELDRGHPPEYPCVLHTCDNTPCANPRHLWAGTNLDNIRDKERKGRGNQPHGERHPRAKLTVRRVHYIRSQARAGRSACSLAQQLEVHPSTVGRVISGVRWKAT